MVAAVYLYQHSLTRHPLTTDTMLRWTTTARTVDTGSHQYATKSGPTYVHTLTLSEQLTQMCVVGALVPGASQMHDPGDQGVGCGVGRTSSSIAVSECGCSALPIGGQ